MSVSAEHDANLGGILEDRIILEMLHIYGVQPALYDDLVGSEEGRDW